MRLLLLIRFLQTSLHKRLDLILIGRFVKVRPKREVIRYFPIALHLLL